MTIHLKDGDDLRTAEAVFLKDRGTLYTITDAWYKDGDDLRHVFDVDELPNAIAPTLTLSEVLSVEAGSDTDITATISGGTYDSVSYDWTITSGGGSISGNGSTGTYTAPSTVSVVIIQCTVTAHGTGTVAKAETEQSASRLEPFIVVASLPNAAAPTMTIAIGTTPIDEDETTTFTAVVTGGTYDTISYAWTANAGSFTGSGSSVTYAPNVTGSTHSVTNSCVASVTGTGTEAVMGTSDSVTAFGTVVVNPVETLLPDADAPTLTVSSLASLDEDESHTFTTSVSGGTYDRLTYAWSISSGGGSLSSASGDSVTYTPTTISADTNAIISCTVTAHGDGGDDGVAREGTTDTDTDTESFTVNDISDTLPAAAAPTLTVSAPASVTENGTASITSSVSGGTYDTITYAWSISSGSGEITGSGSSVTYTAPSVTQNTTMTIRCEITVAGDNENAKAGSSASNSATDTIIVTNTTDLPDAVAPTVTVDSISSITEAETLTLGADVSGGTYDNLEYTWTIPIGGGTFSSQVLAASDDTIIYNPPDVTETTGITVRCSVKANGTGTNAERLTSDTALDDEYFTVTAVSSLPDADVSAIAFTTSYTSATVFGITIYTASISAAVTGDYDTIVYTWTTTSGTITGTGSSITLVYTSTLNPTVTCSVSVTGTDINAVADTEDTYSDTITGSDITA